MTELSQTGKKFKTDVLVIGSGLAGIKVILEIAKLNPNAQISLVTKGSLQESNSFWAQGGIAAAQASAQSIQQHVQDTLRAGDGLCLETAVQTLLAQGSANIDSLRNYGVNFDGGAEPDLAQEGGHSQRRIYHCGDRTGQAVMTTLINKIKTLANLSLYEHHTAVNLITASTPHAPATIAPVIGAYVLEEKTHCIHVFHAKCVILACGGAGKVYRYTSNCGVVTGDGIAMAYRAGARVGNLEFYQFHPTLLYHAAENNILISEALRGEGAQLLLPGTNKRFMQQYDAERLELSTRDIIARAIFNEIERGSYDYVELDIRHHSRDYLRERFPGTYKQLQALGIDMVQDRIPIVPAAHYCCGGVLADVKGSTDLPRLYAIGETAFTGLHGANRLASNSLLECAVMATLCAEHCQSWLSQPHLEVSLAAWNSHSVIDWRRASQINAHWRGLRGEMTSYAGIIRTAEGLKDLLRLIKARRDMIEEYYWQHAITRDLLELRNIVLLAELIVSQALRRHESRGGHYREDYPVSQARAAESIVRGSLA